MSQNPPEAVTKLLVMYQQHTSLLSTLNEVEGRYAKAKILNKPIIELSAERRRLSEQLQHISDTMTFSDPLVWIQYKYYAYQNDAQPITTMHDFRVHCSKPGYICTKRFEFLNKALIKYGFQNLSDKQAYDDALDLSELFRNKGLNALLKDELFMNKWNLYEYHREEGIVAKWKNYRSNKSTF